MKLQEWLDKTGNSARLFDTYGVVHLNGDKDHTPLWHSLEDWEATQIEGDTIALIPKNPPQFTFKDKFKDYVCEGDTISVKIGGVVYTARIENDDCYSIDDDDCHNEDQSVTGCDDEQFAKLLEARKAYFRGEWFYCGIIISATLEGSPIFEYDLDSLWGIEVNYPGSNNDYLTEVANDMLPLAIKICETELAKVRAKIGNRE